MHVGGSCHTCVPGAYPPCTAGKIAVVERGIRQVNMLVLCTQVQDPAGQYPRAPTTGGVGGSRFFALGTDSPVPPMAAG